MPINPITGKEEFVENPPLGTPTLDLAKYGEVDFAADALDTSEIAALAVTTAKIAALAVTTPKIAALAVTAAELAADAVTTTKIAALAVTTAKIAALAVTAAEISAGAVTAVKVETDLIQYRDTQLTNAQVLALNSTPIDLVPTPGANRAILVHSVLLVLDAAAGAYSNGGGGDVEVEYGTGANIIAPITVAGFLDSGTLINRTQAPAEAAAAVVVNSVVRLNKATANFGGGNAANTLSVRIYYSVVDTIAFT